MDKTTEKLFLETLGLLTAAIEEHDPWLQGPPQQVAGLSVYLAQALGLPQDEVKLVYLGALLHDFGMLYLPADLLGRHAADLTAHEFKELSRHPLLGEKLLAKFSPLAECLPFIRHHHEAFDGSGYPDRLKGQAIPAGARIVAVVEAFLNLTSPRSGEALSAEAALEELAIDPQLDPEFVKVLTAIQLPGSAPEPPAQAESQQAQARQAILEIVGRFQNGEVDLPVLPNVISRIQELVDSPVASVIDLAAVIEQDAVISGKLISVANSPIYRGAERVCSLGDAVVRLGHNETQLIVGTLASRNLYEFDELSYQELALKLWRHSLASAYLARLLSVELSLGAGSRFYALGLMHDIGKVLLLHSAAELMKKARASNFEPIPLGETLSAIDTYHNAFGAALLKRWRFTPVFSEVAEQHDRGKLDAGSSVEVRLVALASLIATEIGFGSRPPSGFNLAEVALDRHLSFEEADLNRVADETKRLMQASLDLL